MASAFDLTGRTVVVTGGNRGIGLAMARSLAAAGAEVAIWSRDGARNEEAAHTIAAEGGRARSYRCDVTDGAQVDAAMAATVEDLGGVDALFSNAGAMPEPFALPDYPTEEWHRCLAVNLHGAFHAVRAAARHMQPRGRGSIVITSSIVAGFGYSHHAPYAVAKAGLVALARSAAVELARHGIRVNAFLPGWTETELVGGITGAADGVRARQHDAIVARIPMRRFAAPEDVADIAVYLASDASRYHTGDTITVDGGYTVH